MGSKSFRSKLILLFCDNTLNELNNHSDQSAEKNGVSKISGFAERLKYSTKRKYNCLTPFDVPRFNHIERQEFRCIKIPIS